MTTSNDISSFHFNCMTTKPSPTLTDVAEVTDDSEDDAGSFSSRMSSSLHVSFTQNDQVFAIPNRETFTQEEIRKAWHSKDEYQAIKSSAFQTIQLQKSGVLPAGDDYCMRGLERRTNEGFNFFKSNRDAASFAVIDEQDRQDEVGICDADLIANVYFNSSFNCRCLAHVRGLLDAQEVMQDVATSSEAQSFSKDSSSSQCLAVSDLSSMVGVVSDVASTGQGDMEVDRSFEFDVQNDSSESSIDSMDWSAAKA